MKNSIWEKRIPTLLGLGLIIIGLGITSYLATQGIITISKAGPNNKPENIRITNISDSSATISYRTSDKVIGSINYGTTNKFGSIGRDDRDQQNNSISPFNLHNITLQNLKPSNKYYFSITSGSDTFKETGYQFQTASKIESDPSQEEPISGKVVLPDGQNPKELIIYATIDGAQTISTLAKQDGSYILPLNSLRTKDFKSYFQFNNNSLNMQFVGINNLISNVIVLLNQTRPVPIVTLSKNYNFSEGSEPIASDSAILENFPSFAGIRSEPKVTTIEADIDTPIDNESFSDRQPLFKGTALPNSTVTISIQSSNEITEQISTDKFGKWTFRPSTELAPGEHTITITTQNGSGTSTTVSKRFIVFASGTQVTESATPSANPTITIAPSIVPTIIPTTTIATPTSAPQPTTPTSILLPSPTIVPAGSSAINYGIVGLSISLFGGFLLLLGQRKTKV